MIGWRKIFIGACVVPKEKYSIVYMQFVVIGLLDIYVYKLSIVN